MIERCEVGQNYSIDVHLQKSKVESVMRVASSKVDGLENLRGDIESLYSSSLSHTR